jgi:enoyl-[acyl-carrier protein] reductase I
MYNLLKEKRNHFGALDENSIAWKTAERIYEEGGVFVLTNAPASIRMGSIAELAQNWLHNHSC